MTTAPLASPVKPNFYPTFLDKPFLKETIPAFSQLTLTILGNCSSKALPYANKLSALHSARQNVSVIKSHPPFTSQDAEKLASKKGYPKATIVSFMLTAMAITLIAVAILLPPVGLLLLIPAAVCLGSAHHLNKRELKIAETKKRIEQETKEVNEFVQAVKEITHDFDAVSERLSNPISKDDPVLRDYVAQDLREVRTQLTTAYHFASRFNC